MSHPTVPGICSHLLECHKFVLCDGPSVDLIFVPKGGQHREFLFGQVTERFEFAGMNFLQSILHTMLFCLNERPGAEPVKTSTSKQFEQIHYFLLISGH